MSHAFQSKSDSSSAGWTRPEVSGSGSNPVALKDMADFASQQDWLGQMFQQYGLLVLSMLATGLFAGFVAGLFGIGGGFVVVPALAAVLTMLPHQGGDEHIMHVAIGTSLATIFFTSLRSVQAHARRGAVDWNILKGWLPWVVAGVIGGVALAAVAMSSSYRVRRLTAFLDPWADPFNTGFQLTQSLIAIGRGGWTGVGLGESVQKLFYLPEAHTDFLFAVLAEELGLLGVVLTLGLFLALVWRALFIARLAADAGLKFQSYLAAGFAIWLGLQAFINIGVNMGALPTKGLTLPFMSYGRSSLIVTLAWVGMLLRVYHEAMQAGRGSAVGRRGAGVAA